MKPSDSTLSRTGAQLLIDALKVHGVDLVFGVPGESYLDALDAFYDAQDQIKFVICRQEGGVANMAEAYGKLTGRPGIALVSRGPGATNASIAVHTAQQDALPLVLVVGQVPRADLRREAFQEIDYRRMYGTIAKWVFEATEPGQLAEAAFKAIRLATSGTPWPLSYMPPRLYWARAWPWAEAAKSSCTAAGLWLHLRPTSVWWNWGNPGQPNRRFRRR